SLLKLIIRKARVLVDAEVSCLMLRERDMYVTDRAAVYGSADVAPAEWDTRHEPASTLRVRVADHSGSKEIEGLPVPVGKGIGGLATVTGVPIWTPDYFADQRLNHDEQIDRATREEGLVAVLAVPMRVREHTVGVLCVGNRSSREFEPGEVELVCGLADHAALTVSRLIELDDAAEEMAR